MKQKTLEKMAEKDAEKWAAAEMFYGDGAGIRRKMTDAYLDSRLREFADTDYPDLLRLYQESVDLNKFAEKAIKERKWIDRGHAAKKNFNAIRTGRLHQLSTGVYVVGGLVYIAHATGYDKKVEAEAKKLYAKAKAKVQSKKSDDVSHIHNG